MSADSEQCSNADQSSVLSHALVSFQTQAKALTKALEEQTKVLQEQLDKNKDKITQSKTHANVNEWRNMGDVARAQIIDPQNERLRTNYNSLLIFMALFTAIVAAFFVDSLKNLKQDETALTNTLLANLTNIVLALNAKEFSALNLSTVETFTPEPVDVRFNFYLSNSLMISLAISAASLVLNGFLILLSNSYGAYPRLSLTKFYMKWLGAEKYYQFPLTKLLPSMMAIPVVYFLVGFLDYYVHLNLDLPRLPTAMIFLYACTAALVLVLFLFGTVFLVRQLPVLLDLLRRWFKSRSSRNDLGDDDSADKFPIAVFDGKNRAITLSPEELKTYNDIIQRTYDSRLHKYAAQSIKWVLYQNDQEPDRGRFEDTLETIRSLLSPYASSEINKLATEALTECVNDWKDYKEDRFAKGKPIVGKFENAQQRHIQRISGPLRKKVIKSLCEFGDRLGETSGYQTLYLLDPRPGQGRVSESESESKLRVVYTLQQLIQTEKQPDSQKAAIHLVGCADRAYDYVSLFAFQILLAKVQELDTEDQKDLKDRWFHIFEQTKYLAEASNDVLQKMFLSLLTTLQYIDEDKNRRTLLNDFTIFICAFIEKFSEDQVKEVANHLSKEIPSDSPFGPTSFVILAIFGRLSTMVEKSKDDTDTAKTYSAILKQFSDYTWRCSFRDLRRKITSQDSTTAVNTQEADFENVLKRDFWMTTSTTTEAKDILRGWQYILNSLKRRQDNRRDEADYQSHPEHSGLKRLQSARSVHRWLRNISLLVGSYLSRNQSSINDEV